MKRIKWILVFCIVFSICMVDWPLGGANINAAEATSEIGVIGYDNPLDILWINQFGKSYQLYVNTTVSGTVSWVSSDKLVVTVSTSGLVKSVSNGTAKISVMINSQVIASLNVKVIHYGDTNEDGEVDITDLNQIRRHIEGIEIFPTEKLEVADLNGDGKVNDDDLTIVRSYIQKLITNFPVEEMVRDIFIVKLPDKLEYKIDENLDTTGIKVEARYRDGSCSLTDGWLLDSYDTNTIGENTVKISYEDTGFYMVDAGTSSFYRNIYKSTYNIIVKSDILSDNIGMDIVYAESEKPTERQKKILDLDGDGALTETDLELLEKYLYSGEYFFPVENQVNNISVKQLPEKITYNVGEELDLTGLKIQVQYNNGRIDVISEGFECIGSTSTPGKQDILVSYGEDNARKTTTFNIEVYAIDTYTVSYDANGGNGAPAAQIKNYGESVAISRTQPIRAGYIFLGWSTSNTATSADEAYAPGSTYDDKKNLNLYAVWKVKSETSASALPTDTPSPGDINTSTSIPSSGNTITPTHTPSSGNETTPPNTPIPATPAGTNINVKQDVTISGPSSITKVYGKKRYRLTVKTMSNGKISYKSSNKKVVTVDEKGNVSIKGYGKATITVKVSETSEYKTASKKIKVSIIPAGVKRFKAKSKSSGRVTFTWKRQKIKNAKCQIQASLTSDFQSTKSVPSPSLKKGRFIADGLKRGTTYYFRIRVSRKIAGKTYYSGWIKKKVKIK